MPQFWEGFSKQQKKPGWRRSSNCVQNAFFQLSPSGRNKKTALGSNFTISVLCHHFGWAFPSSKKNAVLTKVVLLRSKRVFSTFPIEAKRKTALGSNFTISVLCHNFGRAFPSSGKSRIDEGRPIAFKTGFFYFPHRGETKKHLWDRILQFRFHGTILDELIQATEKAGFTKVDQLRSKRVFQLSPSGRNEKTGLGWNFTISVLCHHFRWDFPRSKKNAVLTKVVQLRSKRVFSTFPIAAKRKNTLGIEFYNFGFMPPFWVGFSNQWKKPGLQSSSNCVQNTFFKVSLSGRNEKKTLGIDFTISVSCHHFERAFPSNWKSRVDEGRPIAFKTRFFNFSHLGQTKKKQPWDQILQFRFHATILGGIFQAAQKAGFTKVVQLRSKHIFKLSISGRNEKKTLGIEIYNFGFMPPFWVGLSKQRKKPGLRRSSNCIQNTFLNFPYRVETKKKPLGSKFTISVSCHHFGWAFPISGKSRVDQGRPIAFKTRFLNFPYRVETKKNPWDRFYNFGPISDWGLYNFGLVNSLGIEFYNFGFMPPFWVGFSKQRKKPGWRRSSNCVQNAFFQLFPSWPDKRNSREIKFCNFGFMPPFCVGFSKQRKKPGWRRWSNCVQNAFFQLFPSSPDKKNSRGIKFYKFSFMPPFWVRFSKQRKKPGWRRSSNCVPNAFFQLSPRGETKKHHWDRILQFRFHATILGGLFQAAEKAGLTKVVQLRSKRVFSTFPIGAKRKNTLGIEFYNFGFMAQFRVGFSKQRKKPGWRKSSNSVRNAFFLLSPLGRNEKTPLGSNFTVSVSCHHFGWAFPSSGKNRVHEGRPIAFKTRFFNFPHRGETKKHHRDQILQFRFPATILGGLFQAAEKTGFTKVVQLRSKRVFSTFPIGAKRKNTIGIEFYNFGFLPPFWVGFSKQRKKPGWRRSSNCVKNAFFQLSPSGRNGKTPLGSNFTISVSCRIDEGRPIAFKTRFFNFPHRGETEKHPWDRILQFRFHATILGGLFQAAEKTGFTKVVQFR